MPLYTYVCADYHEQEIRHGMTESPVIRCPTCGGQCRILVGVAGIPAAKIPNRDGYHPGLALYPGDRSAYVDGPRAMRRLLDDRKRRGLGDPVPPDELVRPKPVLAPPPFPTRDED